MWVVPLVAAQESGVVDLVRQGALWLESQRKKFRTVPVVYVQGRTGVRRTVDATVGRTQFAQDDAAGAALNFETRDYIVAAESLVIGCQRLVPERGDRIEETDGAVTYVYEVVEPGGSPCWRYADGFRLALRIHTVKAEEENA